jgi:hypothetical protein
LGVGNRWRQDAWNKFGASIERKAASSLQYGAAPATGQNGKDLPGWGKVFITHSKHAILTEGKMPTRLERLFAPAKKKL